MLNLTMKDGDYLLIGDDVKISFSKANYRDSLFLSIDAPRSVNIVRGKLYEKIIAGKVAEGDAEAIEINEQIIAANAERERDRLEKARISRYVKEKKASQKATLITPPPTGV